MFATVTTWRLAESVQPSDAQDRFLREMFTGAIDIVRDWGVLDVVMVEVEPDRRQLVRGTRRRARVRTASAAVHH